MLNTLINKNKQIMQRLKYTCIVSSSALCFSQSQTQLTFSIVHQVVNV